MAKTNFYKIAALTLTLSIVMGSSVFASTIHGSTTQNRKNYCSTSAQNNKLNCNFKSKSKY